MKAVQVHAGLYVRGSHFSVVLTKTGKLGWLTSRLFPPEKLDIVPLAPAITSDAALQAAILEHEHGFAAAEPTEEIAFRTDGPVLAWKVRISDSRTLAPWLYIVAADDGNILERAPLFGTLDLTGNVRAKMSDPNKFLPDVSYNPPVECCIGETPEACVEPEKCHPMRDLTVKLLGYNPEDDEQTSASGDFSFSLFGNPSVILESRLISLLFTVNPTDPADALPDADVQKLGVTPQDSPVQFILNQNPSEVTTSQINAFVWTEKSRDYADFLEQAFAIGIHQQNKRFVEVFTNDPGAVCGGKYEPEFEPGRNRILLGLSGTLQGDTCVNTAYSTVVAHEVGHHFTREIQIANGDTSLEFSAGRNTEGCADVFAVYLTGQPILGQDFTGQGTIVRDVSQGHVFPDPGGGSGQALSGSFWDLRTSLESEFGSLGTVVAESFFAYYVQNQFQDRQTIPPLSQNTGLVVEAIDSTKYGGFYRDHVVDAFARHNLYRLPFVRGDCNGDGVVDATDGPVLIAFLMNGSPVPDCLDTCDVQDDGTIDASDATHLYTYVFSGGAPPASPFPGCGVDPTLDSKTCIQTPCAY